MLAAASTAALGQSGTAPSSKPNIVFILMDNLGFSGGAHAVRNFGVTLVALGILMLVVGIVYHLQFMRGLRHTREEMTQLALIHGESLFPHSFTLLVAVALLAIGLGAIVSIVFHIGPFG